MDSAEFEQLILEILDSLPSPFADCLQNVEVLLEPRPGGEVRRKLALQPWQTLYGLYEGVPLTQRSSQAMYMPARITIFQEPFMRHAAFPGRLREEVRRTVLHELAHHLGISDERLRELGAY